MSEEFIDQTGLIVEIAIAKTMESFSLLYPTTRSREKPAAYMLVHGSQLS